ncbi:hypothetical protein LTR74_017154 [Friedmanniomyces endolithicus]|nr:hypothetical protein LTR74_017154 [Friedmanniomyces endolithicus]
MRWNHSATLPVDTHAVNVDSRTYVATELSRDWRLSRLRESTKLIVQAAFAEKANGMFGWAYCQLQEFKKLKSSKAKFIKEALLRLPATLDETYEKMLGGIDEMYRDEALTVLRWLAFERRPLRLCELVEACIANCSDPLSRIYSHIADITSHSKRRS